MSLLYESIQAVIAGGMLTTGPQADTLATTCVNKLHTFLEENDQNCIPNFVLPRINGIVKYVGLLALSKITSTHADLVSDHHDIILFCINDADISIRLRALDLIVGMISRDTLTEIVKQLMSQLLEPPPDSTSPHLPDYYRAELVRRILAMSTRDNYSNIGNNFEWYVAVLVDLARIAKVDVGRELGEEILNVTVRVKSVRNFSVKVLRDLLRDFEVMISGVEGQSEVLAAAAWVVGEYCRYTVL
jgi:AP-3 complex subunit delta